MNTLPSDDAKKTSSDDAQQSVTVRGGSKEGEGARSQETPRMEEPGRVEIAPEAKEAGLEEKKEYVDIPPDVKQLGVTNAGASAPVADGAFDDLSLPLTDVEIEHGTHAQPTSSISWLAQWCIRKLKRVHIVIKKIHGKVMRVKT